MENTVERRRSRVTATGDKTLDILLILLIGAAGIVMLVIAWVRLMPMTERIMITSAGFVGLFWVFVRALWLRSKLAEKASEEVSTKDNFKKKPY